jgi:hypothetical protein
VIHGEVHNSFLTNDLTGSFASQHFAADGFGQDRPTVLAGRMSRAGSTGQIALTPVIARAGGRRGPYRPGRRAAQRVATAIRARPAVCTAAGRQWTDQTRGYPCPQTAPPPRTRSTR